MAILDKDAAMELGMVDPDAGVRAKNALSSAMRSAANVAAKKSQGKPWRCARVKRDVTMDFCIQNYVQKAKAKIDGTLIYSPCLECSIVDRSKVQGEVNAYMNEKKHPFSTWKKLDSRSKRSKSEAWVTLGAAVHFNVQACIDLELTKYQTVDVFKDGNTIGLEFHADDTGHMKLTHPRSKNNSGVGCHFSKNGLCTAFGLDPKLHGRMPFKRIDGYANVISFCLDDLQKTK